MFGFLGLDENSKSEGKWSYPDRLRYHNYWGKRGKCNNREQQSPIIFPAIGDKSLIIPNNQGIQVTLSFPTLLSGILINDHYTLKILAKWTIKIPTGMNHNLDFQFAGYAIKNIEKIEISLKPLQLSPTHTPL